MAGFVMGFIACLAEIMRPIGNGPPGPRKLGPYRPSQ